MAYSEQVLRRARARLEQAKQERERENAAHRQEAYERYPRLKEIDRELQLTMAQLMATALRHGEDPTQAIAQIRDRNLALQRERDWILEAGDFEEGFLDDAPVCAKCGGTGYEGNQMCSCLRELCRQEQKKELTSLLGSGRESFDTFHLDVYSDVYDDTLGTSPRKLMQSNFNICRRYAQNFTPQSGNLLFSGATGLGKTFMSACIARQVADRGFSVVYETAIRMFADFEAEKFGGEEGQLVCDVRGVLVERLKHQRIGKGTGCVEQTVGDGQADGKPTFSILAVGVLLTARAKIIVLLGLHNAETDDADADQRNGSKYGQGVVHVQRGQTARCNAQHGYKRARGIADGRRNGKLDVAQTDITQRHGDNIE